MAFAVHVETFFKYGSLQMNCWYGAKILCCFYFVAPSSTPALSAMWQFSEFIHRRGNPYSAWLGTVIILDKLVHQAWLKYKQHISTDTRLNVVFLPYTLSHYLPKVLIIMTMSSNGKIFCVTGPLCGEFTGHRWIPRSKASDAVRLVIWDAIAPILPSL